MEDIRIREEVLAELVQMLESDQSFTDIVQAILSKAEEYLDTTNANLLQIDSNGTLINSISEFVSPSGKGLNIIDIPTKEFQICNSDIVIENEESCQEMYKTDFDNLGVKSCVIIPIEINGMVAMYLSIFDQNRSIIWKEQDIQFIRDVAIIIQSIAQKKVTGNSLLSSYEVLKEILSSIGCGIIVCKKDNGRILFENRLAEESQFRRTMKLAIEDYYNGTYDEQSQPSEYYDSESELWFEMQFVDINWVDGTRVMICSAIDITQKKINQQKIEFQAQNDYLTGLHNRMKCEQDLSEMIKVCLCDNKSGAVLFIDLDDFKHINDGLGHQYGDILLRKIAIGLQDIKGIKDNCYRMGGDEFIVVISPDYYDDMDFIVNCIVELFRKPWFLMDTEYYCTMSMGIVTFPTSGTNVNDLIKKADIAMYEAKKGGKNRFTYYDEENDSNPSIRLDIENNMRQAVAAECNEFVVFYQPVIDTVTQKCYSCEALVRWDSKVLGFMAPGQFIPMAEYLGLITYIGDYVFETACKQCRIWNESGYPDFRVNINLSVIQLLQKNVIENISRIINESGVNPKNVVLEITETLAINDMERVMKIIDEIKELGVGIALDDFGTGYSSLNYIKQLPLDIIKVDKTFIDDIVEDEYAQAFIKLIVDLCKAIGTKICVEGIECSEQYELLKNLGVDYIQGYYFGKPVDAVEFEKRNLKYSR